MALLSVSETEHAHADCESPVPHLQIAVEVRVLADSSLTTTVSQTITSVVVGGAIGK
jgi:hypothetical protein